MKVKLIISLFVSAILFPSLLLAETNSDTRPPWNQWVQQVRDEALAQGIRPEVFDEAFAGIKQPHRKTLNLDKRQPEKRLTYVKYRNTRGDAYRIKLGKKYYKKYQPLLEQVGQEYGVSPCMITALWGIESSYGNYLGSFPVIQSLATLAYDQRRGEFFRKQLMIALKILNDGHIDLKSFKGEWAGASGHPQFLPSSWYKYAVDYNGDGHKDIWKNHADVFASIANYLLQNGWQTGEPWDIEVQVPPGFDTSLMGKKNKLKVSQWQAMGVRNKNGGPLPYPELEASIIEPYGGPHLLTYKNFDVIKRYNNSTYYAGTVGYVAEGICNIDWLQTY